MFISDTEKLAAAVSVFRWELLPAIIGLTLFNYGVRFLKWHWYLGVVGVKNLHWVDSLLDFYCGLFDDADTGQSGRIFEGVFGKTAHGCACRDDLADYSWRSA